MFRPARHKKNLGFDQVRPSEIRFDRRDQNIYISTKLDQARYVPIGSTKLSMFRSNSTNRDRFRPARPNYLCSVQIRPSEICFDRHDLELLCSDQVRPCGYVLTGATKTSRIRPSSTMRDTFRPARPKHLCFDQIDQARYGLTSRPKHLGSDQVRPCEIRFDRRDQNI